jgi:hypothetical protein
LVGCRPSCPASCLVSCCPERCQCSLPGYSTGCGPMSFLGCSIGIYPRCSDRCGLSSSAACRPRSSSRSSDHCLPDCSKSSFPNCRPSCSGSFFSSCGVHNGSARIRMHLATTQPLTASDSCSPVLVSRHVGPPARNPWHPAAATDYRSSPRSLDIPARIGTLRLMVHPEPGRALTEAGNVEGTPVFPRIVSRGRGR